MDSQTQKNEEEYTVRLGEHQGIINLGKISELKLRDPYALDRYLLDQFKGQGFDFEVTRSQYIRYCYGLFE